MVEIRKLRPSVGPIKMPTVKRDSPYALARAGTAWQAPKVIVRRRRDHPPPTPLDTPCVIWQGLLDKYGYGLYNTTHFGKRKRVKMHRWVMELVLGRELSRKEFVLHACDNRMCYRVEHLSIGTIRDNNADMVRKKRNKKPPVNRHQRGEKHPRAKITQRQVDNILAMYRKGFTQQSIADLSGISRAQVSRICRGVNWRASTVNLKEEHHDRQDPAEGSPDPEQDADT